MKPLIEAGKKGWDEAGESLHNVISDESIENLGKFNDQLGALQSEFNGLKDEILGQLAPSFTDIAKALTDMLVQFGDWAKSESGQKALGNLSDAISNIVKDIGEDDFENLINTATSIIEGLAGAINSITNDPSGIIDAVKGALIGYATLSVSKEVLSLLTLLRSLGGSGIAGKIGSVFDKLGSLFVPGASAEGAAAAAGGAAVKAGSKLSLANAGAVFGALTPYLVTAGASVAEYTALENAAIKRDFGHFMEIEASGQLEEFVSQASTNMYASLAEELLKGITMVDEGEGGDALIKTMIENREILSQFIPNLADMIAKEENGTGYAGFEWYEAAHDAIVAMEQMAKESATETITTYTEEINAAVGEGMASVEGSLEASGEAAGNALAAGLLKSVPNITNAVRYIQGVVAQIQAGPATTTAYGVGLGKTGASVTRNNNIYINNLNQSNAADIYDTLRNMDNAQNQMNRGYGYVFG